MNPDLNYLIAMQKSAELRRAAELARLAGDDRATAETDHRDALAARTTVRLKLRRIRRGRLRIRRAFS
jgi:hypothetical protein